MYHYQEMGVALSESVIYFSPERRLAELFEFCHKLTLKLIVPNW